MSEGDALNTPSSEGWPAGVGGLAATGRVVLFWAAVGVCPWPDPFLCRITALMGSVVAGAGVNPADQRWVSGRFCRLAISCRKRSEGLFPDLSLIFCAIGLNDVQLSLLSTEVISAPRITKACFGCRRPVALDWRASRFMLLNHALGWPCRSNNRSLCLRRQ